MVKINIMLDSGAYSAWTKGVRIELNDYIGFVKERIDFLSAVVNLDVIPGKPYKVPTREEIENSAGQGWLNYCKMLEAGIPKEKLIHVFHQGEDFKWLGRMVKRVPYIGLSPGNDRTTREKTLWLDKCMEYVLDKNGEPLVKFHGFGVTTMRLVLRYPWFSVDSMSWKIQGGLGLIVAPSKIWPKKKEDYYPVFIPVGKGRKQFKKEFSNTLLPISRITEMELSFRIPERRKKVAEFMSSLGFRFEDIHDYKVRSMWIAVYTMYVLGKFSSAKLYLAASDFDHIVSFVEKLDELGTYKEVNFLVSYARVSKRSRKSLVDKIIDFKLSRREK